MVRSQLEHGFLIPGRIFWMDSLLLALCEVAVQAERTFIPVVLEPLGRDHLIKIVLWKEEQFNTRHEQNALQEKEERTRATICEHKQQRKGKSQLWQPQSHSQGKSSSLQRTEENEPFLGFLAVWEKIPVTELGTTEMFLSWIIDEARLKAQAWAVLTIPGPLVPVEGLLKLSRAAAAFLQGEQGWEPTKQKLLQAGSEEQDQEVTQMCKRLIVHCGFVGTLSSNGSPQQTGHLSSGDGSVPSCLIRAHNNFVLIEAVTEAPGLDEARPGPAREDKGGGFRAS
ncbi:hypothetical protein DV515_00009626 [Chloebia gouldiae]|uniref:Uncharacterized protein n=1 Tax=Chloebia gouldiae TaxID=44316 RepID=A0A3L8SAT5_CHLGU|nr:hypothetical protein DV515_00009626 [Chloebia gouldiae]